jgi:hypothetical protein
VAALVVHFMPDPARGVAEMTRVVRPGGCVAAYAWDLADGGFPCEAVHRALRSVGMNAPDPPHPEAADAHQLQRLWVSAGLVDVEQREIMVSRTFGDIAEYWRTATRSPRIAAVLEGVSTDTSAQIMLATQETLPLAPDGTITPTARANAIVGLVPAVAKGVALGWSSSSENRSGRAEGRARGGRLGRMPKCQAGNS